MVSESDKPGFVSKFLVVVINLENLLPNFSSDLPKKLCRNSKDKFLLFGLALGGVYHAIFIAKNAVRSYHTFSPLPNWRYIFCGTFPRVAPAGGYPAPYFYRARTFLFKKATTQLSDKIKILVINFRSI